MAHERWWCGAAVVAPDGVVLARFPLAGEGDPDLSVVDGLARRALGAARLGGTLVLSDVAPRLRELLWLSGLAIEVEREAEGGEEPPGVQEREEEA